MKLLTFQQARLFIWEPTKLLTGDFRRFDHTWLRRSAQGTKMIKLRRHFILPRRWKVPFNGNCEQLPKQAFIQLVKDAPPPPWNLGSILGSQQRKQRIYNMALSFMRKWSPVKYQCLSDFFFCCCSNKTEYEIMMNMKWPKTFCSSLVFFNSCKTLNSWVKMCFRLCLHAKLPMAHRIRWKPATTTQD